jgi:hypothetical protein
MIDRSRSAAASIYPDLKSGARDVVERRQQGTVADAMYAHLKPPPPKLPNPYIDGLTETEWSDMRLAMRGLRRKR